MKRSQKPKLRAAKRKASAGPGRPSHKPTDQTRRQVGMMAAFGNTEAQIALILSLSEPTLRRHYAVELATGHLKATNAVAANLFKQATKDDVRAFQAMQFWLRCRAGWSEYAPAPKQPAVTQRPGKKEQAKLEAQNAEHDTGWSGLVN